MGRKCAVPLIIPLLLLLLLLLLPHQSCAGRQLHSSLWSAAADYLPNHHLHNSKMLKSNAGTGVEQRRSKEAVEKIIREAKECEELLNVEEKNKAENDHAISSMVDGIVEDEARGLKGVMEEVLRVRDSIVKTLKNERWKSIDGKIVNMEKESSFLMSGSDKETGENTIRTIYKLKSSVQHVPQTFIARMEKIWLDGAEHVIKDKSDVCVKLLDDLDRRMTKGENLLKNSDKHGIDGDKLKKIMKDFFIQYRDQKFEPSLTAVEGAVHEMQALLDKEKKEVEEEKPVVVVLYKAPEEEEKSECEAKRGELQKSVDNIRRRVEGVRGGVEQLIEEAGKV